MSRPATPEHPFAVLSKYSPFGLGGGVEWIVLFKALTVGIAYIVFTSWQNLGLIGSIGLGVVAVLSFWTGFLSIERVRVS